MVQEMNQYGPPILANIKEYLPEIFRAVIIIVSKTVLEKHLNENERDITESNRK